MEQVQRNFFIRDRAATITSGLKKFEVWPGYSFSINIYEAGLFLCSNVRAKVMPLGTVLDVIKVTYMEVKDQMGPGVPENRFIEQFRLEVIRRVAGIQVRTMFNNKTYRVDDIAFR